MHPIELFLKKFFESASNKIKQRYMHAQLRKLDVLQYLTTISKLYPIFEHGFFTLDIFIHATPRRPLR